jgi:hypothetical protein
MSTDTTQPIEQVQNTGLSRATIEATVRYIWGENFASLTDIRKLVKFTRAIERVHGIIE